MAPERKVNPVLVTVIVIILVVGLTVGILLLQRMNDSSENTNNTTTTAPADSTADTPTQTTGDYSDGEYTETGSYSTPGGTESITVTVTLAGGKITDISADGSATAGNSATYQRQFLSGYEDEVVGKDIDQVSLSRVAGSSLTSDGFNRAIEAIKLDASA